MDIDLDDLPRIDDELEVLAELVPLRRLDIVELGCGPARLLRALLHAYPDCRATALEVDERQHAKNLAAPQERLTFLAGGAEAIPLPAAAFDLALMLKSLHHVPVPQMAEALRELARVLRPGGLLYVSEPIYGGSLNELVRLYNDEREVRAAAQAALDDALRGSDWAPCAERRFAMPVHFAGFDQFEQRMMRPTFADHGVDDAMLARVRAVFEPLSGPDGAWLSRPLHVRVLRRR